MGDAAQRPGVADGATTEQAAAVARARFTFAELFAGIGGFRVALEALGGACVWECERDEAAKATYRANFGCTPYHDVRRAEAAKIPEHDVLTAGFPCQDFTGIGLQAGLAGERGALFYEVVRIARAKRPRLVVLENVKGLVTMDEGRTMERVVGALEAEGYAVSYGLWESSCVLPQYRMRVYALAFRDVAARARFGLPPPAALSPRRGFGGVQERGDDNPFLGPYLLSRAQWARLVDSKSVRKYGLHSFLLEPACVAHTLLASYRTSLGSFAQFVVLSGGERGLPSADDAARKRYADAEAAALAAADAAAAALPTAEGAHAGAAAEPARSAAPAEADGAAGAAGAPGRPRGGHLRGAAAQRAGRAIPTELGPEEQELAEELEQRARAEHAGEAAAGGTAGGAAGVGGAGGAASEEKFRPRWMTPRECARLQGFPEGFVLHPQDPAAYRQLGNAVCPPVVALIAGLALAAGEAEPAAAQSARTLAVGSALALLVLASPRDERRDALLRSTFALPARAASAGGDADSSGAVSPRPVRELIAAAAEEAERASPLAAAVVARALDAGELRAPSTALPPYCRQRGGA